MHARKIPLTSHLNQLNNEKKTILFLGAALCMTTACSDDDNNGNEGPGGGNGNGNVPVTTVEQAQEEIDRVGKALAAKIDVERLKPTISLLEYW